MEDNSPPLEGTCLIIIGKLFTKHRYSDKIKKSKELTCQEAHLHHNDYPQIIKEIIHIKFSNLVLLQLSNNRILNIESVQFLQAENLKNFHLSFNDFIIAKSLRKCSWPNLQKLSLMGTRVLNLQFLQQCNFPKLNNLLLEDTRNPKDSRLNSCNFLSKTLFWPDSFSCCDKDKLLSRINKMLQYRKK